MELEQAVQQQADDAVSRLRERTRRRVGAVCAAGVFVGIGAGMVVAAVTDNALAAVVVVGVAVISALGAVMALG